jgi:2-polyprenyl-3-methyl-5-hydroxy-6-metoxy-1,4-benzoquinol methylase
MYDWDEHYKRGGDSGTTDTKSMGWAHSIYRKYFDNCRDRVIDVGCGDIRAWDCNPPLKYTGIDISPLIIEQNREKYPGRKFIVANATVPQKITADIVICMNVLFHIIDDDDYTDILKNLKAYSKKYIIIYTWNKNPFQKGIFSTICKKDTDGHYQKYRDFKKVATPIFTPEFELMAEHQYPGTIGTLYIWKRENPL